MTNTIIHKKSIVPGAKPSTDSLVSGELAVNVNDGKLFTKKVDGTVVEIGAAILEEFKLNYLIAMINTCARLIKTQRIMAETVLRGQA